MQATTHQTGVRPVGTQGRPVSISVNAFAIKSLPTTRFFHYDVIFEPEVKDPHKAQNILDKLQTISRPDIFKSRVAFDGKKNLYSPIELVPGGGAEFEVFLGDRPPPPGIKRGTFLVRIKKVATIEPVVKGSNRAISGSKSGGAMSHDPQMSVNLLQALVRQAPLMGSATYNSRCVFDPHSKENKNIGGGFQLWRGYFQSVRPTADKMILNVDISTAVVYRSVSVVDWALAYLDSVSRERVDVRYLENLTPQHQHWKMLKAALKNVKVTAAYPPGRKDARPIKYLVPNVGAIEFQKDGQPTTIQEYFRSHHGKNLQRPRLFGLSMDVKGKTIVPAEVCQIEPGQLHRNLLPTALAKEALEFSTKAPQDRLQQIINAVKGSFLNYTDSDFVRRVGMEIDLQPMTIRGRLLGSPGIKYNAENVVNMVQGAWKTKPHRFQDTRGSKGSVWAVVSLSERSRDPEIVKFVEELRATCIGFGMEIAPLQGSVRRGSSQGGVERMLEDTKRQIPKPTLTIVVLPDQAHALPQRKHVKVWGDTTGNMATQCVMDSKLQRRRPFDSYYVNLALKINARLGGVNSSAIGPVASQLLQAPIMVLGADVGHPGPGVKDKPSIASLVASCDRTLTRYAAFTQLQPPRVEVIESLEQMVFEALVYFYQRNPNLGYIPGPKCPPPLRNVVFYRDGVSEGEYQDVFTTEAAMIRAGWTRFFREKQWREPPLLLTYIVVGKRHHFRFIPDRRAGDDVKDKSGNVHAGLVVDTEVVSPTTVDFYLQSHGGLLGTSRPAHYIVLWNDAVCGNNRMSLDGLQEFSFYLCHVYARASRSISIPAPVYYADLVCARANYYFDESLESEIATASSETCDIDKWRAGFHPPGPQNMYFV
ncbi:Piwi-domain-containing protein [Artomyces pyxidatus]|uniref:Piwi-domain-containing protein n=1 Tax=Artomyces pyxidatus TaxID=48021 RepID=A0ACB8TA09_9AGAM|nr:Piwi-domain-containing protein [Artomyces pyxidatus]